MSSPMSDPVQSSLALLAATLAVGAAVATATADEVDQSNPASATEMAAGQSMPNESTQGNMMAMPGASNMRMPEMDSTRGRLLFASKGCVVCHSINGIGGDDAAALDAHGMAPMMNPFDFAAKMWRMAPAMIGAQEEELGYQILFSGDELSDIIAFVHDDAEQHKFTEADIPPNIRKMMGHGHMEGHMGDEEGHGHMDEGESPPPN